VTVSAIYVVTNARPKPPTAEHARYSCTGGTLPFYLKALSSPAGAELTTDGPALALRREIEKHPGRLPDSGWRRVAGAWDQVLFLREGDFAWPYELSWADASISPYASVVATRSGSEWSAESGPCYPLITDPAFEWGDWVLRREPRPEDTTIDVWVQSEYCYATFEGPQITYSPTSVTVVFWARKYPAPTDENGQEVHCGFMDEYQRYTIHLAEPLGQRQLLDGTEYPARPPQEDLFPYPTPTTS
jgi:hypothetical protein